MTQLAPLAPLDVYVSSTLTRLDRAVAEVALSAPTLRDVGAAARVIECLLETLAGLAIGGSVGAVVAGVRRTFGVDVAPTVSRAVAPPARPPRYLDGEAPTRVIGGELKRRLRGRIGLGGRDVHAMIAAIERVIEPGDRAAFARMLGVLAQDELVAERYAHQLRAGWRCAIAAIEGRTVPAVAPMWQRWAERLAGERRVIAPANGADVILRIA